MARTSDAHRGLFVFRAHFHALRQEGPGAHGYHCPWSPALRFLDSPVREISAQGGLGNTRSLGRQLH